MMHFPRKVNICECWARDGLQGENRFIPSSGDSGGGKPGNSGSLKPEG